MRAVVITRPHEIEIVEVDSPTPTVGEVILEVAAAGICGTDLHIFDGEYGASLPIIPGHEFAGTVVAVGRDVIDLAIGDRVSADPNIPCLRCRYCHEGRVNLCSNYDAIGVTRPGAMAQYVRVRQELCVKLPDSVDLIHAALIEPLSCALHAYDLLGAQVGKRVVIYGSGTMGLMMLQLAQRTGVRSVDVIDTNPLKLVAARRLGCSGAAGTSAELDVGSGWDLVIDATGVAAAIQDGIDHVTRGGTFLQFGVSRTDAKVEISPFRIYDDEIRILGSVCPQNSFERSASLLEAGAIDPEILISDRVALDHYAAALGAFAAGASRKIVILPN